MRNFVVGDEIYSFQVRSDGRSYRYVITHGDSIVVDYNNREGLGSDMIYPIVASMLLDRTRRHAGTSIPELASIMRGPVIV